MNVESYNNLVCSEFVLIPLHDDSGERTQYQVRRQNVPKLSRKSKLVKVGSLPIAPKVLRTPAIASYQRAYPHGDVKQTLRCRICLSFESKPNLFTSVHESEIKTALLEIFKLDVTTEPLNLPKHICHDCKQDVTLFYNFYQKVLEHHQQLLSEQAESSYKIFKIESTETADNDSDVIVIRDNESDTDETQDGWSSETQTAMEDADMNFDFTDDESEVMVESKVNVKEYTPVLSPPILDPNDNSLEAQINLTIIDKDCIMIPNSNTALKVSENDAKKKKRFQYNCQWCDRVFYEFNGIHLHQQRSHRENVYKEYVSKFAK